MKKYMQYGRMFVHPHILRGLLKIKSAVYTKIGKLDAEYMVDPEPIPFAERLTRPLLPIKVGEKWGNLFECGWFHFTGKVPESAKGQKVVLHINVDGEGCLFDENGTPKKGLSVLAGAVEIFQPQKGKSTLDFAECANGGEDIDIWVETGHNKLTSNPKKYAILKQADIAVVREDIKDLYYDYLTLILQMSALKKNHTKFISIRNTLSIVMTQMKDFSPENLAIARETLRMEFQFGEKYPYKYYAVGHSHLDLAWLWPIRETKRKAGRTLSNTIYNIEKYPLYIYGISQPQQLAWVKEMYPHLYEKVKEYIEKDRIEVQGKMWVECDTNVTGGESLIRQNIYGNKYWLDEFGKTSTICWLPDVFGFSGNLPQILRKCGMEYFLTIKLSWNEHNMFPHRTFIWEGIDDSQVMVHMPPEGDYNSDATPISILDGFKKYPEKEKIHLMGMPYGVGDGGGGPGEGHIECAKRARVVSEMPVVTMAPASKLFNELEGYKTHMKTHKGEMYLEKHQGTYTSQAKNKYYNRLAERKLHEVEFLSTVARLQTGYPYPFEALERIWKEILLYQFHDIIPGSSIKRVYDESVPRYIALCEELDALIDAAKSAINGEKELCAINATSFARDEYITVDGRVYKASLAPYSSGRLTECTDSAPTTMENEIIKVSFDNQGNIVGLYNKQLGKEFCKSKMNVLNVYPDKRLHYNAWDIDIKYTKKKPSPFKLKSTKQYAEGISFVTENEYTYNKSTLVQKVIVTKGSAGVKFQTKVDWQETHKMLRAEFYPSVFGDEVACDIQFGNLKRSTNDKTSIEKAQFEICAHKWIDVTDNQGKYGIALLNDCKYGHRVKEGLISLNLLRSPMYPAKDADKGEQSFCYEIYPHEGGFVSASIAEKGYAFNNPLIVADKAFGQFIASSNPHIVIETVKMAENGENAVIIRAYEDTGANARCTITTGFEYKSASLADMLENETDNVSLEDIEFAPYEIKTIKLKV